MHTTPTRDGLTGPDGCNLFVFHIPNTMTNEALFRLFSKFGNVISARIMVEKATGRSRGFGEKTHRGADGGFLLAAGRAPWAVCFAFGVQLCSFVVLKGSRSLTTLTLVMQPPPTYALGETASKNAAASLRRGIYRICHHIIRFVALPPWCPKKNTCCLRTMRLCLCFRRRATCFQPKKNTLFDRFLFANSRRPGASVCPRTALAPPPPTAGVVSGWFRHVCMCYISTCGWRRVRQGL